ncbi:MAG: hypothetical protein LBJ73_00490 [Rickettsiales bacterium]|jgi:hypothetical protein|nr:hypothetical protein [Rickettsiales bacterium]
MKFITSTELESWGNTRESQDKLPLLLRRLIINGIGFDNIDINMPGGDSVWKPGVDGSVITKKDSFLGGKNTTYIVECGQTKKSKSKFKDDLVKRTKKLHGVATSSVFIFITTHKWKNKSDTIKSIRSEVENSHLWADIKTFDADDIETGLIMIFQQQLGYLTF